jgi:uronate dehydrogenase
VTGSSGVVGRRLCASLVTEYEIVQIDRAGAEVTLDITDLVALKAAFKRCETVIHLAAAVLTSDPWDKIQKSNIEGTYNVFEAARQAGCGRVIFASSHHAVGMYQVEQRASGKTTALNPPLSVDVTPRPDSLYAVSKVFGEALGRYYSDAFGMQVACIRIGSMNDADSPTPPRSRRWRNNTEVAAKWLSHRDFARLVRAILGRNVAYAVVYGVGDNVNRSWDLTRGREIYDYFPLDGAK